jgi:hypothetical protein
MLVEASAAVVVGADSEVPVLVGGMTVEVAAAEAVVCVPAMLVVVTVVDDNTRRRCDVLSVVDVVVLSRMAVEVLETVIDVVFFTEVVVVVLGVVTEQPPEIHPEIPPDTPPDTPPVAAPNCLSTDLGKRFAIVPIASKWLTGATLTGTEHGS